METIEQARSPTKDGTTCRESVCWTRRLARLTFATRMYGTMCAAVIESFPFIGDTGHLHSPCDFVHENALAYQLAGPFGFGIIKTGARNECIFHARRSWAYRVCATLNLPPPLYDYDCAERVCEDLLNPSSVLMTSEQMCGIWDMHAA